MSHDQQVARVNVGDDDWIEFRAFAMQKRRSVADYLGELVRRELSRAGKPSVEPEPVKRDRRRRSTPVRLSDQDLLTEHPRHTVEPPRWEE